MYKTAKCIRMLMILFTRDVVSIRELAKLLNTNPRNVPEYRKELEAAGYYIQTVEGKYGGYKIDKSDFFPSVRLTEDEMKALSDSFEYLSKRKDFPTLPTYKSAMEKMFSANRYKTVKRDELLIIPRHPLKMPREEIHKRYAALSDCTERMVKMEVEYRSNDNILRKRIIHPYKMYMYDDAWFVLAYCELVKEIRYFKINRITSFIVLPDKFDYIYSYREGSEWHEWLDEYGMKRNGDWFEVKLKFTGRFAMIAQDYWYGKDQITECVDANTTILTMKMQYKDSIPNFVLKFGGFCEVLEPQWLKDAVIAKAQGIIDILKK